MEQYTFEAILLLAILANYHKSDAAKLNPYLKRTRERQIPISWQTLLDIHPTLHLEHLSSLFFHIFALKMTSTFLQSLSVYSYNGMYSTLSLGSMVTRLRAGGREIFITLVCMNTNPFFSHRPIEASVVLLPIYEFLFPNLIFSFVLTESFLHRNPEATVQTGPLSCAIISVASYFCTHASSTDPQKPIAYTSCRSMYFLLLLIMTRWWTFKLSCNVVSVILILF